MDVTAQSSFSENNEEVIDVDREKNCRADCPLSDTIANWEPSGILPTPLNITLLVLVDVQQQSQDAGAGALGLFF